MDLPKSVAKLVGVALPPLLLVSLAVPDVSLPLSLDDDLAPAAAVPPPPFVFFPPPEESGGSTIVEVVAGSPS